MKRVRLTDAALEAMISAIAAQLAGEEADDGTPAGSLEGGPQIADLERAKRWCHQGQERRALARARRGTK